MWQKVLAKIKEALGALHVNAAAALVAGLFTVDISVGGNPADLTKLSGWFIVGSAVLTALARFYQVRAR